MMRILQKKSKNRKILIPIFYLLPLYFIIISNTSLANTTATYLGGNGSDVGSCITKDIEGNIYIGGNTPGQGFPITPGAYGTTTSYNAHPYNTAFISKFDPTLKTLLASTYLRFSETQNYGVTYIDIDPKGNVIVAGDGGIDYSTKSFVAKLNSELTQLLATTSFDTTIKAMAVGSYGNVYLSVNDKIYKLNNDLTRTNYEASDMKSVTDIHWKMSMQLELRRFPHMKIYQISMVNLMIVHLTVL